MSDKPRPYLTAALLCEKVLEEKNGTISIMRILDRIGYQLSFPQGLGLPQDLRPALQFTAFIGLKSGTITGEHTILLVAENPKGKRTEIFKHQTAFLGGDQGQNFTLNLHLGVEVDGLHWFDVLFDDEVLTRIPVTIAREPESAQTEIAKPNERTT